MTYKSMMPIIMILASVLGIGGAGVGIYGLNGHSHEDTVGKALEEQFIREVTAMTDVRINQYTTLSEIFLDKATTPVPSINRGGGAADTVSSPSPSSQCPQDVHQEARDPAPVPVTPPDIVSAHDPEPERSPFDQCHHDCMEEMERKLEEQSNEEIAAALPLPTGGCKGVSLPGSVCAPDQGGFLTVCLPAEWQGKGRPQVTMGAENLAGWTGLSLPTAPRSDRDQFHIAWQSRPAGRVEIPLEWQPISGDDWQPSDGTPVEFRTLTIECRDDPLPGGVARSAGVGCPACYIYADDRAPCAAGLTQYEDTKNRARRSCATDKQVSARSFFAPAPAYASGGPAPAGCRPCYVLAADKEPCAEATISDYTDTTNRTVRACTTDATLVRK